MVHHTNRATGELGSTNMGQRSGNKHESQLRLTADHADINGLNIREKTTGLTQSGDAQTAPLWNRVSCIRLFHGAGLHSSESCGSIFRLDGTAALQPVFSLLTCEALAKHVLPALQPIFSLP